MKRLAACIAIVTGTVFLMYPPDVNAGAGSKIDSPLHLTSTGVHVTGSIVWESDEVSQVITVHIVQGSTSAFCTSRRYFNGTDSWSCNVTGSYQVGSAVGHAVAKITKAGGAVEYYRWTVSDIQLVR